MTKASDNAFPSLLITEGTEPSAPAAGKQRLYIDSTTHLLKATNSSGTDRTIESSGTVTGLLAVKYYDPGSIGSYTTTTTQADVDATNAAVTFTAPSSGNVLVRCNFQAFSGSATGSLLIGLRESTTNIIDKKQVLADTTAADVYAISVAFYLTGVTAGSHTYKLAAAHATNSFTVRWGGGASSAMALVIEVWAAP